MTTGTEQKKHALGVPPIDIMTSLQIKPEPLDFVLPGLLAGTVGVVVSPGGTGKSWLMLESCFSVGIGEDVADIWGQQPTMGRVVYLVAEDPQEVLERRIHGMGHLLRVQGEDERAARNVEIIPAYGQGFRIADMSPLGIVASTQWNELTAHLLANPARLLVLDTYNRLLGGISENDSGAMGAVLSIIEQTCRKTGCAAVLVHHTNKNSMATGTGSEQSAARGSSAITDNARWQANLSTMSKEEGEARNIASDEDRRRWVRLDLAKVNYGPPIAERWLHKGLSGELSYGEPPPKVGKANKASRKSRKEDYDVDQIPY